MGRICIIVVASAGTAVGERSAQGVASGNSETGRSGRSVGPASREWRAIIQEEGTAAGGGGSFGSRGGHGPSGARSLMEEGMSRRLFGKGPVSLAVALGTSLVLTLAPVLTPPSAAGSGPVYWPQPWPQQWTQQ